MLIGVDRNWAVWDGGVYDMTDYLYTQTLSPVNVEAYSFLNSDIVDLFKQRAGQDISTSMNKILASLQPDVALQNTNCLKNAFFLGGTDFRKTARCQVQNYILIIFSGILMASMGLKCALCLFLLAFHGCAQW